MLSLLIFLPFISILLMLSLPLRRYYLHKIITLVTVSVQLLVAAFIYFTFQAKSVEEVQFSERITWFQMQLGNWGEFRAEYFVGIDGINAALVLLTAIVFFVGTLASWEIKENRKGYFSLFLLLASSVYGCFVAMDMLLFFVFFEFMLLPMYFLIGIWGGPRREYAAIKFFIYTLLGSILILLALIALNISVADPLLSMQKNALPDLNTFYQLLQQGKLQGDQLVHSFNMLNFSNPSAYVPGTLLHLLSDNTVWGWSPRFLIFWALVIGFLIKLPSVPFHTWLPDAHVEAPTPISVILAGVLLKIGAYGLIRVVWPVFPEMVKEYAFFIGMLGVVSILYAGFNALAQTDLKKMIAYSSVSHMGFVLLGLASVTPEGINGALYQLVSHGIIASLLFIIAGVLYDRTHDRSIANYSGLALKMPLYTSATVIAFFASFGLPGFSGFIAEIMILLGAFDSNAVNGLLPIWMSVLALGGIIIGAVYYLWTLQRMFFGKFWIKTGVTWKEGLYDLTKREIVMILPLAFLSILFGVVPSLLLNSMSQSVSKLVQLFSVL